MDQPIDVAPHSTPLPIRQWRLYTVEALTSAGSNLLVTAIYFYMNHQFSWGLKENLLLACGQGIFYVPGAMAAGSIARRMNRRMALVVVYLLMAAIALTAYLSLGSAGAVAMLLLLYSTVSAVGWPIIESLASSGLDSRDLSRRIAVYNFVWSTVSIIMIAGAGALISYWSAGIFLVPLAVHGIACILMFAAPASAHDEQSVADPHTSMHPEPELLRARWRFGSRALHCRLRTLSISASRHSCHPSRSSKPGRR